MMVSFLEIVMFVKANITYFKKPTKILLHLGNVLFNYIDT
jgi:hypothetical protein